MSLVLTAHPLLKEHTTLRLGGPALALAVVRGAAGLDQLGKKLPELGGAPFALGFGSNLLAGDGQHALVLVHAGNDAKPEFLPQGGTTLVRVGAGFGLPRLLGLCQRAGLGGLEGLTGVPGRLGGAVAMNAGSYGVELGGLLARVRVWTPEGGLTWREASDCSFGYRHFNPNMGPTMGVSTPFWLIWEVELLLRAEAPATIRQRMEATYAKKKATQPVTAKSAGCVFKNPAGHSAGKLLDDAGLRGKRLGGMAFSAMHANFLVNEGEGTASQALELMELGRAAVLKKTGLTLQTEVVVL